MNRLSKSLFIAIGCLLALMAGAPASAATARAVKFGTTLPTTCYAGDIFFNTNAPAGANLFACVAPNTWVTQILGNVAGDVTGSPSATTVTRIQGNSVAPIVPQAGQALVWNGVTNRWEPQVVAGESGSGASMATQLGDFSVILIDTQTLTIGANCLAIVPCNIRFGGLAYSLTGPVTVSLTGGTGDAFVYLASSGTLTVGHSLTLTCSGVCSAQSGITAFPTDAIPLFTWHATNGTWDDNGADQRAFLSSKDVIPGTGILTTENLGHTTIAADPSVIGMKTTPPSTSSSSCTAGMWASDSNYYYVCVTPNTWLRAALSSW